MIDAKWANKDLWSERELQYLCCGLDPDQPIPNDVTLNEAEEDIKRAVLSGDLPCICPSDPGPGDKLYGHARFFRPPEAMRWADGLGWKVPKEFSRAPRGARDKHWPWGNHETELLRQLGAAADRFWKRYDQGDETTAPKNSEVIDWLKSRNVSERTAEIIATILRADGLRPGPRS